MFINLVSTQPFFFFSWIIIITFSICVHEYAHAQTALWKGDETAARAGHLSLNPLVQMGVSSLVMLAIVGIAWGAVPVDVRRMRGRSAAAQVAFAGPAANLLLCILFALLQGAAYLSGLPEDIYRFLSWAAMANGVLFLFNMLPVPMFDGWAVLSLFVPVMAKLDARRAAGFSWIAIIVLWTSEAIDYIWAAGSRIGDTVFVLVLKLAGAA